MKASRMMGEGLGRVVAAPPLVLTIWALNLLVALPAAIVVGEQLHSSIGSSEAGERLLDGFDFGWHGELMARAEGLVATLEPGRLVSGGWLANLDGWWSGRLFEQEVSIVAFGACFALVWILLSGAALAQLHRPPRRFTLGEFFADGAGFFWRFVRLALLAAPLYFGVFRLARWFFGRIEAATIELTVERTLFGYYLLAALSVILLLATVKMVFDYAKVAIVVGERRSALLAAFAGFGFVARRPASTYGLVLLFALVGIALLAARELVVPGLGQGSLAAIAAVFLLGQVFLIARLGLRLGLLASQLALYEEETK